MSVTNFGVVVNTTKILIIHNDTMVVATTSLLASMEAEFFSHTRCHRKQLVMTRFLSAMTFVIAK
jgi:hypothetical protein